LQEHTAGQPSNDRTEDGTTSASNAAAAKNREQRLPLNRHIFEIATNKTKNLNSIYYGYYFTGDSRTLVSTTTLLRQPQYTYYRCDDDMSISRRLENSSAEGNFIDRAPSIRRKSPMDHGRLRREQNDITHTAQTIGAPHTER